MGHLLIFFDIVEIGIEHIVLQIYYDKERALPNLMLLLLAELTADVLNDGLSIGSCWSTVTIGWPRNVTQLMFDHGGLA